MACQFSMCDSLLSLTIKASYNGYQYALHEGTILFVLIFSIEDNSTQGDYYEYQILDCCREKETDVADSYFRNML